MYLGLKRRLGSVAFVACAARLNAEEVERAVEPRPREERAVG